MVVSYNRLQFLNCHLTHDMGDTVPRACRQMYALGPEQLVELVD